MTLKTVLQLMKIKHYIKNTIVFIPLIFSLKIINGYDIIPTLFAFISFCLISSAVYVFNDIVDSEKDKLHPIKRKRPIASGLIPLSFAWKLFIFLTLISVMISISVNSLVLISIISYLLLNIWYSLQLKYLPILDVVCIALGFILRILAGCAAIYVPPSALVILLTFFTSMFFTFSKRKLEYQLIENKQNCRKSIAEYNEALLNHYVSINAILSIAFYFTYMLDSVTIERAGTSYLYITVIPFSIIIFRLLLKIFTCANNDDPSEFIYKDKTIKTLFILYFITLSLILIY